MQLTSIIASVGLAAVAAAQTGPSLSGLPQCAQAPALSSIGNSGCQLTDIACVCKNQAFISGLTTQVAASCSPSDQAAAASFAQQLCAQYGVTLPIPGGSTSAAPVVTTTAATTYLAPSTTTYVYVTTGTGTPAPPSNGTTGVYAPTPTIVTGAANSKGVQAAGLALVAAVGAVVAL